MSASGEIIFLICGLIATVSAVLTVSLKSPLRAAVALLVNVVSVGGLYLTLHAHLLAAIQLLVYAGAVVVLFVFVIMLIGPSGMKESRGSRGLTIRIGAGALMAMIGAVLAYGAAGAVQPEYVDLDQCAGAVAECAQFGSVEALGTAIFQGAAVPFELVSILLLVAVVAAVAVARGHTPDEKKALEERGSGSEATASAGE